MSMPPVGLKGEGLYHDLSSPLEGALDGGADVTCRF